MSPCRLFAVTLPLVFAACSGDGTPSDSGDTDTTTVASQWYLTCGDPACQGYTGPFPGVPLCSEAGTSAGDPCAADELGAECDPEDSCNARLVCATEDPTQQTGGCPISRVEHKQKVAYLSEAEREATRQQLLALRLARWEYRGDLDDGAVHMGFLIDDAPTSPAVRPDGEHVDLYGYTSMAVAAIQQQQAELDELRAELKALREACQP